MKRLVAVLCGLVLGLFLIFNLGQASVTALAPSAGYSLSWWTVDGGGGESGVGAYQLGGTIGQADAGASGSGAYILQGGFWPGAGSSITVYIPAVKK